MLLQRTRMLPFKERASFVAPWWCGEAAPQGSFTSPRHVLRIVTTSMPALGGVGSAPVRPDQMRGRCAYRQRSVSGLTLIIVQNTFCSSTCRRPARWQTLKSSRNQTKHLRSRTHCLAKPQVSAPESICRFVGSDRGDRCGLRLPGFGVVPGQWLFQPRP